MYLGLMVAALVVALALAAVAVWARSRASSKEQEVLRELGFVPVQTLQPELLEALRLLHAPKAKQSDVKAARILQRKGRAADLYFVDLSIPEGHQDNVHQASRSLSAYQPHWRLPRLTVLTTKEPENWMERALAKALESVVGKRAERIAMDGFGEFSKRAIVFGPSELDARRVLSPRVQRALMEIPYLMFESLGPLFTVYRPAQAGRGENSQEQWRRMMDAARAIAEDLHSAQ